MNRIGPENRRRSVELAMRLDRTPLTKREKEVVSLLVSGASTRSIAEQTKLTVATVHTYLKRIYSKLGVHSRVELVARMVGTVANTSSTGVEHDHDLESEEDMDAYTNHDLDDEEISTTTATTSATV
jgi:DNA-binding CsgD family transcriptional regulator